MGDTQAFLNFEVSEKIRAHCGNEFGHPGCPRFYDGSGNPASAVGLNLEGMRRRDFSADALAALKESHKIVYRSGLTKNKALTQLAELRIKYPEVEGFARSIESQNQE